MANIPVETPNEPAAAAMRDFLGIIPTEDLTAVASPDGTEKVAVLAGAVPGFMTTQEIADLSGGGDTIYPTGISLPSVSVMQDFLLTGIEPSLVSGFATTAFNGGDFSIIAGGNLGVAVMTSQTSSNATAGLVATNRLTPAASTIVKTKARVQWPDALPDGTENYSTFFGHNPSYGVPGSGMAGFRLRWDGSAVVFDAITQDAGTRDTTVLTTPTAGQWYTLEVVMTGTGDAKYYVDGVLVATHTNLPTTGNQCPAILDKLAGTTARRFWCDWIAISVTRP